MKNKTFKIKHLPFIRIPRKGLDSWERMKQSKDKWASEISAIPTTFVSIHSLKEKARNPDKYSKGCFFGPLVWQGSPGLMSRSWVTKYQLEKEHDYRFGTGGYCSSEDLLLVDDIFEWAHRRIESKDVRSAFDLIIVIQNGELEF